MTRYSRADDLHPLVIPVSKMAQNGARDGPNQNGGQGDSPEAELINRRRIRRDYRELMARAKRERSELIRPESDGLDLLLERQTALFERVTHLQNVAPTSEAVMDAQLLKTLNDIGYQKAKKLHFDNKFDPTIFMEKLVTFMNGRTEHDVTETEIEEAGWLTLASEATPAFRRAPSFHFMYGTFEREPPKKRPRAASKKDETAGPTVVPEKVRTMVKSQQEVTTEEVERMVGILHQLTCDGEDNEPVSYFEFVIDPHSFSQTVENIFHLSFVLKDGHASISLDDDGLPVILPAKPHDEEKTGRSIPKKQVLITLDMQQWEELIRVFDIREPLIPSSKQNGHT